MPKVPQRPLSLGEHLNKIRTSSKHGNKGTKQFATFIDDPKQLGGSKNGIVRVTTLQAFKCSKCNHVASNRVDFNEHYSLQH